MSHSSRYCNGCSGTGRTRRIATLLYVPFQYITCGHQRNGVSHSKPHSSRSTNLKQLRDSVWERHGTSWIWDDQARNCVCTANEVWSLRQLLRAVGKWPDDLPSNSNRTLVVAGLDGTLDLLTPSVAETWLGDVVKEAILSFQSYYEGEAALIFWLPSAGDRIKIHTATDAVSWRCPPPHGESVLDFGRVLWGEAREYPQEILLSNDGKAAGLFHRRIT